MPITRTAPHEGVYGIPFEHYQGIEAINQSALKWGGKSGAHMRAALDGLLDKDTEPRRFGRVIHDALFDPQSFAARPVPPFKDFRTDAAKLWKKENPDFLTLKDSSKVKAIASGVMAHANAAKLLTQEGGQGERTLVCHDKDTDLFLKCRVDYLAPVVVDGKSTRDASPSAHGFPKQAAYMGCHLQEAFYRRVLKNLGFPCNGFIFLAFEKEPPFAVTLIELDGMSVSKGEEEIDRLLALYKDCKAANHWPAYSEKVERVTIPEWALKAQPYESAESYDLEEAG